MKNDLKKKKKLFDCTKRKKKKFTKKFSTYQLYMFLVL